MRLLISTLFWLCAPALVAAQESSFGFGSDQYAAGQNVSVGEPVGGDVFLAGNDIALSAPVSGDAHLAGFDVNTAGPVDGNVYAMGFSVDVTGAVGGDVTAAGNTVTLRSTSPVGGNARLAGSTVTVASPIRGAALVTAQTLVLDAPVSGDLSFYGDTITFGSAARVGGAFIIQAPQQIDVPVTVATADRVQFTQYTRPDYMQEAGRTATDTLLRRLLPELWIAGIAWLVFVLIGAAMIALMPRTMSRMQLASERHTLRSFGLGILALAALFGLVPLFAITIVGLLAVPVVLLIIALFAVAGYVLGTYFTGLRIAGALASVDTNFKRMAVLAVFLAVSLLLAIIPVIGWLFILLLTIFGLGAMAVALIIRWSARDAERLKAGRAAASS
jgi:hypothetical protein